ncbi:MAG TPA: hypothetical protein VGV17_14380 [Bosea sp. (in: a-proteobacteria)]|jgi:hypothetical protein|uniref:hypothetical protein n=1 Tax=Bosea sp. (in: a-proteobacteria) TaxID=1871050 RepID=UPI002DDD55B0|nr:hypothetical protein [Bosea sp. (in: a-proteobacteria)]HEV2554940.1 hypothetical protein [Bosea sp. (in: a-proteobacteria)]
MKRDATNAVFVSRQTAAERLEISVDTFDTWVRTGFLPTAHIDRGQIIRWHWPSIEMKLLGHPDVLQPNSAPETSKLAKMSGQGERLTHEAAEVKRRYEAARAQWERDVPTQSLTKRERDSLGQLRHFRVGELVRYDSIKGLGIGTAERLALRGFIEVKRHVHDHNRLIGWILTKRGREAAAALTPDSPTPVR